MRPSLLAALAIVASASTACRAPSADDGIESHVTKAPCAARPGVHREQTFQHEGDTRVYELFVPSSFTCDRAWPLLVEFHGAYGGERPEEAYIHDELLEVAERRGVVLARLRARPSLVGERVWYYWDFPEGDLDRNRRAATALVQHLSATQPIDPARVWASGYSSGGNLVLSMLAATDHPFRGLGVMGAGLWANVALPARFGEDAPRLYVATGYRDYYHTAWRATAKALRERGYPEGALFERETDGAHSFLPWHADEYLTWFEGRRPEAKPARATWTRLPAPASASLLEAARAGDGSLVVSDAAGGVHRLEAGAWRTVFRAGSPVVALAAHGGSSTVLAGTTTQVVASHDDGRTFAAVPPVGGAGGQAHVNGLAAGELDWIAAGSTLFFGGPSGDAWAPVNLGMIDLQAVAQLETREVIAIGWHATVLRLSNTGEFSSVTPPAGIGAPTLHAVRGVGSKVFVAGEGGTILRSLDAGSSFHALETPTREDLYALAFAPDGRRGVAVGIHGTALLTEDGGETWADASVGEDIMLAGAAFDAEGAPVVIGEKGAVLRLAR